MNGVWVARLRWRRRGAWMWPMFAALTFVDAVVGHVLPPTGESQTIVAAALLGCALNLLGVVLLSRPLGALLRRARGDLPPGVARDYGGTVVVSGVAAALLIAGIAHQPEVTAHRDALREAEARAEAWIGARAPGEFRRNAAELNTYVIEAGTIYRTCVPNAGGQYSYCVVVKPRLPLDQSVSYAGSEPNSAFAAGAQ